MQPSLVNSPAAPIPFLRWAGGKTWLVRRLRGLFPIDYENYHEPFLGGGAVFFHLQPKGVSFLGDANAELINAYSQLRANSQAIIDHLKEFTNDRDSYYRLRARRSKDSIWMAARFIFLNRTSYNGIYRVNRNGEFNVPYGHDEEAPIFSEANLRAVEATLSKAEIQAEDFYCVKDRVARNDFVFIDPPYTVMHSHNGFIAYNQKLFSWEDQERLAELVAFLEKKKAKYMVTNAAHESVRNLYADIREPIELSRSSTITSRIEKRARTSEYLFTNVPINL